jgi:hypothetical protein
MAEERERPKGPIDPLVVPRFAGPSTFARLPTLDEVGRAGGRGTAGGSDPGALRRTAFWSSTRAAL